MEDSSGSKLDQALINERILAQLDTIDKCYTAIEQNNLLLLLGLRPGKLFLIGVLLVQVSVEV